jgi:hypothetical protein
VLANVAATDGAVTRRDRLVEPADMEDPRERVTVPPYTVTDVPLAIVTGPDSVRRLPPVMLRIVALVPAVEIVIPGTRLDVFVVIKTCEGLTVRVAPEVRVTGAVSTRLLPVMLAIVPVVPPSVNVIPAVR